MNKQRFLVILPYVLIFLAGNWIFHAVREYGLMEVMAHNQYILYSFPISLHLKDLFGGTSATILAVGAMQTIKLNRKTMMQGKEHGSAEWGDPKDLSNYLETETYWHNGMPVSKTEYESLLANQALNLKLEYAEKKALAEANKKNFAYESFEEYKTKTMRTEKNQNGTTNNLILSATEKITLSGRAIHGPGGRNTNVVITGGSGTGKTRFYVLPNIMQLSASYIITDPKASLLPQVGEMLRKNGYEIRVLDLIDFERSMKYNPFAYCHREQDVLSLVNTLMTNTDPPDSKPSDPFWPKAEQLLYEALFGLVWAELPKEEKNLNSVKRLMSLIEIRENDENFKDVLYGIFQQSENVYLARKKINPDLKEPFYLRAYREFRGAAGKTGKSIKISADARLGPFNLEAVANLVSRDEMHLENLGETKAALFLVLSATDSTYNFIAAMLYNQMFHELMDVQAAKYPKNRLPRNVVCILDEFCNIGKIPEFDKKLSVMRSYGISASIILQSRSQLQDLYGKEKAASIVGNCDTEIFLGGKDLNTLKELSESLGKKTIDAVTTSKTYSSQNSEGTSYQILGRELLTVDELKRLPDQKCIVEVRGLRPFYSDKYDVTKHPRYRQIADGQPGGAKPYEYHPKEKRKKRINRSGRTIYSDITEVIGEGKEEQNGTK